MADLVPQAGRTLLSAANYTVSGCDVLQGRFVALYAFDEVRLFKQTLGPMAYTAAILVRCSWLHLGSAWFI